MPTPLILWASQGAKALEHRADKIRKLLDRGGDPDAGREAPLTMAAMIGHLDIAEVL